MAAVSRRGPSLYQRLGVQWKRGWNEIPEVMGGLIIFTIGVGLTLYDTYRLRHTENKTKQFKMVYKVMRPDDPDVKWLHRNDMSPPMTRTKLS